MATGLSAVNDAWDKIPRMMIAVVKRRLFALCGTICTPGLKACERRRAFECQGSDRDWLGLLRTERAASSSMTVHGSMLTQNGSVRLLG